MTEVWFDPQRLPFHELLAHGRSSDCATNVWTTTTAQLAAAREAVGEAATRLQSEPRADKEPKYYLLQTPFQHVPMTAAQAARCNAALAPGAKGHPKQWLSPRQLQVYRKVQQDREREWPVAVDVPITAAWAKVL